MQVYIGLRVFQSAGHQPFSELTKFGYFKKQLHTRTGYVVLLGIYNKHLASDVISLLETLVSD